MVREGTPQSSPAELKQVFHQVEGQELPNMRYECRVTVLGSIEQPLQTCILRMVGENRENSVSGS